MILRVDFIIIIFDLLDAIKIINITNFSAIKSMLIN